MVIANGDVLDGATISRHPRIGWESRPTVQQEIEAMCLRMREVELAASGAQASLQPDTRADRAAAFAQGLQKAGYATDPAYADKLTRVINTTLRLQRSLA